MNTAGLLSPDFVVGVEPDHMNPDRPLVLAPEYYTHTRGLSTEEQATCGCLSHPSRTTRWNHGYCYEELESR